MESSFVVLSICKRFLCIIVKVFYVSLLIFLTLLYLHKQDKQKDQQYIKKKGKKELGSTTLIKESSLVVLSICRNFFMYYCKSFIYLTSYIFYSSIFARRKDPQYRKIVRKNLEKPLCLWNQVYLFHSFAKVFFYVLL